MKKLFLLVPFHALYYPDRSIVLVSISDLGLCFDQSCNWLSFMWFMVLASFWMVIDGIEGVNIAKKCDDTNISFCGSVCVPLLSFPLTIERVNYKMIQTVTKRRADPSS